MLNSSIWRAVLSLFYPPVIIRGKNGKNSENPVGSNKSEKRKPKSAVYRSFWASVVYFHLRLISTKSHKREMTRNAVGRLKPTREFESLHLRHMNEARFSNIFIEKRASSCPQSLEKSRLFSYPLLMSEGENSQNVKRIFLRKVVI